jgi:hypothetical protein
MSARLIKEEIELENRKTEDLLLKTRRKQKKLERKIAQERAWMNDPEDVAESPFVEELQEQEFETPTRVRQPQFETPPKKGTSERKAYDDEIETLVI